MFILLILLSINYRYTNEDVVSSDFIKEPASSVFDEKAGI